MKLVHRLPLNKKFIFDGFKGQIISNISKYTCAFMLESFLFFRMWCEITNQNCRGNSIKEKRMALVGSLASTFIYWFWSILWGSLDFQKSHLDCSSLCSSVSNFQRFLRLHLCKRSLQHKVHFVDFDIVVFRFRR